MGTDGDKAVEEKGKIGECRGLSGDLIRAGLLLRDGDKAVGKEGEV